MKIFKSKLIRDYLFGHNEKRRKDLRKLVHIINLDCKVVFNQAEMGFTNIATDSLCLAHFSQKLCKKGKLLQ
jgi:hypothetical protein